MSDIDHHNSPDKGCTARHGKACAPRRMWVIGLLTVAAAIGITLAFNAKAFSGAACGQWHTQHNGEALGKHVQSAVDHMFKRAEASAEQTEHARATIESAASTTTLSAMMTAHHAPPTISTPAPSKRIPLNWATANPARSDTATTNGTNARARRLGRKRSASNARGVSLGFLHQLLQLRYRSGQLTVPVLRSHAPHHGVLRLQQPVTHVLVGARAKPGQHALG